MSQIAILKSSLARHISTVWSVAFHPTAPLLATGSQDGTAKLWRFSPDGSAVTCVATLKGHRSPVNSVAFDPTGTILATGSDDNTAKLWLLSSDGSTANCVATLDNRECVNSVAFHPKAPILATGSDDNTAKLWRFSPDGSAANNMSANCVAILEGHTGSVRAIAFHPTALLLASCSNDHTVRLWRFSLDDSAVTCVAILEGHINCVNSVDFNPRGTILATGSDDNTAKLWHFSLDGSAATCMATLEGHRNYVSSVAFHPTAPILATGSNDYTAKLWRFSPDGLAAICMATLPDNIGVSSVAFNPIGTILAIGSYDNTAKLLELNLDSANFDTLILSRNEDNIIINIPPHLLVKSSNNSCPSFTRLYNQIMRISLDEKFRFKFEGQPGYDVGGLTRSIFDKLLPVYTHKFFDSIEKNNEFVILKKDIPYNRRFVYETNQLLLLAKSADTKIFLRIDPRLLDLLLSSNLKKYFSNNKEKFKKFYDFVNLTIRPNNNSYDVLNNKSNASFLRINKNIGNNKNRVIKIYKYRKAKEQEQEKNDYSESTNNWKAPEIMTMNNFEIPTLSEKEIQNMLLREIRLRRFLAECGFSSWEQVQNMFIFIQNFWDPDNFSSELKFDIESFSKKIKIIKENNYNNKEEISLDKFVKLSRNNSMQFDFNNLNNNILKIYADYSFFRPFLNYILGPESTDKNRRLFVNYITGTIYYPGELKLVLSHQFAEYPFKSETCFNTLKFFKSNPQNPQLQINNANKFIEKEIKSPVNLGFV